MEIGVDQVRTTAGLVQVLLQLRKQVPPPGWQRRPASLEKRAAVYASFQRSASDAMVVLGKTASLDPMYRGWANWRFLPHALRTGDELVSTLKQLLGALIEIRMHGNTEPRAGAERMVARITDLAEALPGGSRSERTRRLKEFERIQVELGVMHRDFTITVRRDLGYDHKLREHWWQRWRPRREPEWPGGWPVTS